MSQSISVTDDYDLKKENFVVVLDSRNSDIDISNPLYFNNPTPFTLYSNSNVTFSFNNPLVDNLNVINSSLSVLNFTCPNSMNTINKINDALVFFCDNNQTGNFDEELIVFDSGNYNPNSFIFELNNQLTGFYPNGNWNITFSNITNKISISAERDYYFYSYPYTDENYFKAQNIGTIMGFNDIIAQGVTDVSPAGKTYYTGIMYPTYVGAYNITMPLPVNFSGINSINIYLANLVTQNVDSLTKTTNGIVCNVPVNCPPNDVIYFDKRNDFEFKLDQEYLNSLTIHLKDNLGNFIDLQGQPWNLTLEFSLIRKVPKRIKTFTEIIR